MPVVNKASTIDVTDLFDRLINIMDQSNPKANTPIIIVNCCLAILCNADRTKTEDITKCVSAINITLNTIQSSKDSTQLAKYFIKRNGLKITEPLLAGTVTTINSADLALCVIKLIYALYNFTNTTAFIGHRIWRNIIKSMNKYNHCKQLVTTANNLLQNNNKVMEGLFKSIRNKKHRRAVLSLLANWAQFASFIPDFLSLDGPSVLISVLEEETNQYSVHNALRIINKQHILKHVQIMCRFNDLNITTVLLSTHNKFKTEPPITEIISNIMKTIITPQSMMELVGSADIRTLFIKVSQSKAFIRHAISTIISSIKAGGTNPKTIENNVDLLFQIFSVHKNDAHDTELSILYMRLLLQSVIELHVFPYFVNKIANAFASDNVIVLLIQYIKCIQNGENQNKSQHIGMILGALKALTYLSIHCNVSRQLFKHKLIPIIISIIKSYQLNSMCVSYGFATLVNMVRNANNLNNLNNFSIQHNLSQFDFSGIYGIVEQLHSRCASLKKKKRIMIKTIKMINMKASTKQLNVDTQRWASRGSRVSVGGEIKMMKLTCNYCVLQLTDLKLSKSPIKIGIKAIKTIIKDTNPNSFEVKYEYEYDNCIRSIKIECVNHEREKWINCIYTVAKIMNNKLNVSHKESAIKNQNDYYFGFIGKVTMSDFHFLKVSNINAEEWGSSAEEPEPEEPKTERLKHISTQSNHSYHRQQSMPCIFEAFTTPSQPNMNMNNINMNYDIAMDIGMAIFNPIMCNMSDNEDEEDA